VRKMILYMIFDSLFNFDPVENTRHMSYKPRRKSDRASNEFNYLESNVRQLVIPIVQSYFFVFDSPTPFSCPH